MRQLREFAQQADEFEKLGVRVIGISVDSQEHAKRVWEQAGSKRFTLLSDPGAKVIREYGLLHLSGHDEQDIAIRATILVDAEGRERWRRVSESVADTPTAGEILGRIKQTLQITERGNTP